MTLFQAREEQRFDREKEHQLLELARMAIKRLRRRDARIAERLLQIMTQPN
jgi:hypothetical protein